MAGDDLRFKLFLEYQGNLAKELERLQKELAGLKKESSSASTAMTDMYNKMKIAGAAAFGAISYGIKKSLDEASKLNNSMTGLRSVVVGTGQDFSKAQAFIDRFTQDGLIQAGDAATSLKNLLARGFSLNEATIIMDRFKDSAAFGRQASLELGEAVKGATEGLKNENSILVDNAGVTKNVSVMRKEYAAQLGVSVGSLTTAQKRQAELNGIIKETRFQVGDASKLSKEYSGQVAAMNAQVTKLWQTVGKSLMPVFKELIKSLTPIIEKTGERISKNPELTKNLILVAGALTGVVTVLTVLGGPITAVLAGIGALTVAFVRLKAEIQSIHTRGDGFKALGNVIVNMVRGLSPELNALVQTLYTIRSLLGQTGTGGSGGTRMDSTRVGRNVVTKPAVKTGNGDEPLPPGPGGGSKKDDLKEKLKKDREQLMDTIQKKNEKLADSARKAGDRVKESFTKQSDAVKKTIQDIFDLEAKYKDFGKEAQKSLYEVNYTLSQMQSKSATVADSIGATLGARRAEIQKEIAGTTNVSGELDQKRAKEMQLIREQMSPEQLNAATQTSNLTETEQILQEHNKKVAELKEKQALLEMQKNAEIGKDMAIRFEEQMGVLKAYYTDKSGKEKEIQDQTNVMLAQEIVDKQTAYNKDLENLKATLIKAHDEQVLYLTQAQELYAKFSEYMDAQTKKTTESMITQYQKLLSVVSVLRSRMGGGTIAGPITDLYTPPAKTSSSSVKSGEVVVNISGVTINNGTDEKEFYRKVQEAVIQGKRNADNGIL